MDKHTILAEFTLVPEKETKGCHRYDLISGSGAVTSLYVRKAHIRGGPPPRYSMALTPLED